MFDIGWSEILVIAVVAIVVVGPKELPKMLRTFGKTMGTVRRTANDFQRQVHEAPRADAAQGAAGAPRPARASGRRSAEGRRGPEGEAGLDDARKSIQSIGNPVADLKKELSGT